MKDGALAWTILILRRVRKSRDVNEFMNCSHKDCLITRESFLEIKVVLAPSVQFSSFTQSCPNLCNPRDCSTPCFPVHHQLLELAQTHVHQVNDAIQPSHPLSSPPPPAFNLSSIRVFSKGSVLPIRWPKYLSFSISPSNEHPGLISFRMDWLDLLAVQGTLKSLLQHHSSKVSIL